MVKKILFTIATKTKYIDIKRTKVCKISMRKL